MAELSKEQKEELKEARRVCAKFIGLYKPGGYTATVELAANYMITILNKEGSDIPFVAAMKTVIDIADDYIFLKGSEDGN